MFAEFEDEFKTTVVQTDDLIKALRATIPEKPGASLASPAATPVGAHGRGDKVLRLQKLVNQLKDLITNMDMECNVLLPKERAASKQRVDENRKRVETISVEFEKLKRDSLDADRAELLAAAKRGKAAAADGAVGGLSSTLDTTSQLAAASATTMKSSKKLTEAERLAVEMNEVADNTLSEMERQRHVMDDVGRKVVDTDQELSEIQRILRQMHRTMMKNKAVMAGIIVLLVVMIIALLYWRFGGSSGSSGGGAGSGSAAAPPPVTHAPDVLPDIPPAMMNFHDR